MTPTPRPTKTRLHGVLYGAMGVNSRWPRFRQLDKTPKYTWANSLTMSFEVNPVETISTASDGTELVRTESGGYAVREYYEDPDTEDGHRYFETEYDRRSDAMVHFALWVRMNRFKRPDKGYNKFVPVDIATEGKPAIAAWIYTQGGLGAGSRGEVAKKLDVTKHTVSRYLTEIRDEVAP